MSDLPELLRNQRRNKSSSDQMCTDLYGRIEETYHRLSVPIQWIHLKPPLHNELFT